MASKKYTIQQKQSDGTMLDLFPQTDASIVNETTSRIWFTPTYKTKLDGIAENAEVNKIDSITFNGTTVTITNKVAQISFDTGGLVDISSAQTITGKKVFSEIFAESFSMTDYNNKPNNIEISYLTNAGSDIANSSVAKTLIPTAYSVYKYGQSILTSISSNYIKSSEKGANSGVATLGDDGKIPTSQLPSYVDDVLEYSSKSAFPTTGESGKIYISLDTNLTYRWSGSAYVEISASLALGETSSTAYAGDKGKKNADDIASLKTSVNSNTETIEAIINGDQQVTDAYSADIATKLNTARNISLSGDINGSTTFDGSKDVTINATLSNSGVNAGTYSVVEVNTKGLVTSGGQLIEVATSTSSTASSSLVIGGLFFKMIS